MIPVLLAIDSFIDADIQLVKSNIFCINFYVFAVLSLFGSSIKHSAACDLLLSPPPVLFSFDLSQGRDGGGIESETTVGIRRQERLWKSLRPFPCFVSCFQLSVSRRRPYQKTVTGHFPRDEKVLCININGSAETTNLLLLFLAHFVYVVLPFPLLDSYPQGDRGRAGGNCIVPFP